LESDRKEVPVPPHAATDAALLVKYGPAVQRYCRSQLPSEVDAEEALQETYIRFLQRSDRTLRNPEAWLITVARRACQDVVRSRERRRAGSLHTTHAALSEPAHDDAVLAASLVRDLLKNLRSRDADLLVKLYMSGWTLDEVAEDMNVSPGNVRVMAMRARRRAAKALKGMGVERTITGILPGLVSGFSECKKRFGSAKFRGRAVPLSDLSHPSGFAGPAPGNWAVALLVMGLLTAGAGDPMNRAHIPTPSAKEVSLSPREQGAAPVGPRPSVAAAAIQPVGINSPIASQHPLRQHVQDGDNFSSMTPSPNYSTTPTIFASGNREAGCSAPCPVLYRSDDAGGSWQFVGDKTGGFAGGDILLPPAYPADRMIFAVGPGGLQYSTDGGHTFWLAAANVTRAAVQPGAATGQANILLARGGWADAANRHHESEPHRLPRPGQVPCPGRQGRPPRPRSI
jgi:RNA polymerase sigma factor (sigma-70 family)